MSELNIPKISVIVINFNTFNLTQKCIQSVYEKTSNLKFEVILVDNASNEGGIEKITQLYPSVKLIKSNKNLGFAGGNNLGIAHSCGEYILLLNSDAELENDAISIALQVIQNEESIGVITGQLLHQDGRIQPQAGRFPSIWRELRELLGLNKLLNKKQRSRFFLGTECNYNNVIEADWVWGAFFMFKREDLSKFPKSKLHDTFFMYGEDMQWCYHFKKVLKKRIVCHPSPKIKHLVGGSERDSASGFERYCKKMLPNEHKWMVLTKGKVYTVMFYSIKGFLYYILSQEEDKLKAQTYFKLALSTLNFRTT